MKNKLLATITLTVLFFTLMSMQKDKLQERSYVPDDSTAIKIAEAIWFPIYGEKIYRNKPFVAVLNADKVWEVSGTLNTEKGGVPYIQIQQKDCKILLVTHTK